MSYTDLTKVKLFLGITGNSEDTLLNSYITQTKALLDSLIGDLTQANRTFLFHRCQLRGFELPLSTYNITNIISIDGTAYTGIVNEDYFILPPKNSVVHIKDIYTYITSSGPYYPIEVQSGYATAPEDLVLLQNLMIAGLYNSKNGQEVKRYKLGDRDFEFRDGEAYVNDFMTAKSILNIYMPLESV